MIETNKIYCGDSLEIMKDIEDNSIDAIVTDSPYELGFMGKSWDKTGIAYSVPMWKECLRVLKPGGHLLSFGGTRTYHRMACAIEDAGFEIRDMIEWVYGSGFPKSLSIGKVVDKLQGNEREVVGKSQRHGGGKNFSSFGESLENNPKPDITKGTSEWEGWGTGLKPAHEPILLARKPIEKGLTVAKNCLKWGTGGINIDGSKVGTEVITQNQYDRTPEHGNQYGNGAERKQNGIQTQTTGRFPANLIHDGSDEVVGMFPNTGTSYRPNSRRGKIKSDIYMNGLIRDGYPTAMGVADSGNASRFFKSIAYYPKASKSERNAGCEGLEEKELENHSATFDVRMENGIATNKRTDTKRTNNHPTVKPIALMEYLIKMVSKEGQTILDPFMGSGTTGIACINLNRKYIGIELDRESYIIAEARTNHFKKLAECRLQQEVIWTS